MPSATSPFTITPISSIVAGYSKSACYRCNSGGTDYDFSFQIVQTPDCTLTGIAIVSPLATIVHGASVTSYDHTNFFTPSSVPAGCSLSCSLTDQACGTALSGSEISMPSAASPFTITPISSVSIGYTKNACYRCNS